MSEIIDGTIYLTREDLNSRYEFTDIKELKLPMFIKDFHMFLSAKEIIFTDDDSEEHVFKKMAK
jgi:hypothetical protein